MAGALEGEDVRPVTCRAAVPVARFLPLEWRLGAAQSTGHVASWKGCSAIPATPGRKANTPPASGCPASTDASAGRIDVTNRVFMSAPPKEHIAGFFTGSAMPRSRRPSGVKRCTTPASFPLPLSGAAGHARRSDIPNQSIAPAACRGAWCRPRTGPGGHIGHR